MIRTFLCLLMDARVVGRFDVTAWHPDRQREAEQLDGLQFYELFEPMAPNTRLELKIMREEGF